VHLFTKEKSHSRWLTLATKTRKSGAVTTAKWITTLPQLGNVTAATLSPSGNRVALLTYTGVHLFAFPPQGSEESKRPVASVPFFIGQCEGIAWTSAGILMTTESHPLLGPGRLWQMDPPTDGGR
jgi:hypothetical protein